LPPSLVEIITPFFWYVRHYTSFALSIVLYRTKKNS